MAPVKSQVSVKSENLSSCGERFMYHEIIREISKSGRQDTMSQEMWATSDWKRQNNGLFPTASR